MLSQDSTKELHYAHSTMASHSESSGRVGRDVSHLMPNASASSAVGSGLCCAGIAALGLARSGGRGTRAGIVGSLRSKSNVVVLQSYSCCFLPQAGTGRSCAQSKEHDGGQKILRGLRCTAQRLSPGECTNRDYHDDADHEQHASEPPPVVFGACQYILGPVQGTQMAAISQLSHLFCRSLCRARLARIMRPNPTGSMVSSPGGPPGMR